MLKLKAPLTSGTDTEIDLIEREMEGGVYIELPLEIHESHTGEDLAGLIEIEEHVKVRQR